MNNKFLMFKKEKDGQLLCVNRDKIVGYEIFDSVTNIPKVQLLLEGGFKYLIEFDIAEMYFLFFDADKIIS